MTDERTSLFPEARPGPSYVFPGRNPRQQQRQIKQFQCCICAAFLGVLMIALIIAITYTLTNESDDIQPQIIFNDETTNSSTSRSSRSDNNYSKLNGTEIFNILLTTNWPVNDEKHEKWKLAEPNETVIKNAIYAGVKALGDRELLEENTATPDINTPSYRHQRAVSTTLQARILTKRGYVENHATIEICKNLSYTKPRYRWNIGQGATINLDSPDTTVKCDFNAKYRNSNGTCNNKLYPLQYGVAMLPFRRALHPDYADGISMPRMSHTNLSLPSARKISTGIHRPSYSSDPNFTVMLAVFGQFLDHDITATALNQGQDGEPIDCCDPSKPTHPECFPVPLDESDKNYQKYNLTCMNFIRSSPAPTGHFGPRQQLNQATSFIDGSVVYGTMDEKVEALRLNKDGMLRMYNTPDNRTLLPVSTDTTDGCNEAEMNSKGKYCFESGDTRANENLHLTSMHLIWARHHNFLARKLQELNPQWDNNQLFQEARRILAAQLQHITYNEFLPMVLGKEYCKEVGISYSPENSRDSYDENVDPSIANIFAACAFRFAHTLIPGLMNMTKDTNTTESIELHRMLFNPYSLWKNGGLDAAIGSAIGTSLAKSDQYFTTELTEKLFENSESSAEISESSSSAVTAEPHMVTRKTGGLDLVSLNIQRGRDHGLPAYAEWRKHCQLPSVDTWDQMQHAVDNDSLANMKEIYNEAIDVDVYTGALSEPPMVGAIVGPLLSCLLTDQFLRIKKGDSHWYERRIGPQRFTKDQLKQITRTKLSTIICRNSDAVEQSQPYVMQRVSETNQMMRCSELDTFDFSPWNATVKKPTVVRVDNSQLLGVSSVFRRESSSNVSRIHL